jgi:lycopene cyclase domain-containing protein
VGIVTVAAGLVAAGPSGSVPAILGVVLPTDRYQYLLVLAGCLLVTLPLEVVIGARVYRQPRRLLRALGPAVAVFLVWDVVAVGRGHWWYNPRYVTGWRLPGDLPVEELVFFVVIPVCALLTYEAVVVVLASAHRVARRVASRA